MKECNTCKLQKKLIYFHKEKRKCKFCVFQEDKQQMALTKQRKFPKTPTHKPSEKMVYKRYLSEYRPQDLKKKYEAMKCNSYNINKPQ